MIYERTDAQMTSSLKTFSLCFLKKGGKFWKFRGHFTRLGEDIEESLAEPVDKFQKHVSL